MMFKATSSPFSHSRKNTSEVMMWVALCALPGLLAQSYFFGWGTLIQLLIAIPTAIAFEAGITSIRGRGPTAGIRDNSALLTGILFGLAIPPFTPWWMTVLGIFFAIVIVKQLYGGLGFNPFNPAMAAYVLLLVSFPVAMTGWLPVKAMALQPASFLDALSLILSGHNHEGFSVLQMRAMLDGTTAATPLDVMKTNLTLGFTSAEILEKPIFSLFAGEGWQWVNLAYLAGGLVLIYKKIIQWYIPAGFLGALTVLAMCVYLVDPDGSASPLLHLLSGATMFGAFFIATDPVTASTTIKGRLIFGAIIGVLVYCIRSWGGYPDAVAFSVLLANMCVPLLDHYTKPTIYGQRSIKGESK